MNIKFLKENLPRLIIIVVILLMFYYYFYCTDDDLNRPKIYKKHIISKKVYISPIYDYPPLTQKLQNKLNKITENFDNNKFIIKLFYADWCTHCVSFKPVWIELKNKYSDRLTFIDVDCTESNPNLEYIKGFPTIAIFDSSNKYLNTYNDDRTKDSLESYINNNLINK
jgi:thiol-disulfide isomerase/thioredoxin